jgi:hypothetical protein
MSDIAQQDIAYQPATKVYSFPTNPSSPEIEEKKKGNNAVILLLLEILGLIAVFIVFLLILNFFNLISLSKIYPNQFGFLPHLNQTTNVKPTMQNQTTKPPSTQLTPGNSNNLQNISMGSCVLPEGCQNAVQITSVSTTSADQNFYGLGFNLTGSGSAILAAIDGKVSMENTTENGEALSVVTITDPANVQQFVYKFKTGAYSPTIASGNVKQDQKIGDFNNNQTLTYQSKSYSFILYMYVLISKQYLILQSSTDGLTIESPNK